MSNPKNSTMDSERTYVGNGVQNPGSEYIRLHICLDALLDAMHTNSISHNGRLYVNVVVARKRGMHHRSSHTAYVPVRPTEEEQVEARRNAIADQQELEVRAWDEANA